MFLSRTPVLANKFLVPALYQVPRPKNIDSTISEENARKNALRKERQAQQVQEGAIAMAEYRVAVEDRLRRMAELRKARLQQAAGKRADDESFKH
jgi:hypothetical protein